MAASFSLALSAARCCKRLTTTSKEQVHLFMSLFRRPVPLLPAPFTCLPIVNLDRAFSAPVTSIYRSDFFDGQVYWVSDTLVVYSQDGRVEIYPAVYDAATWENVTPPGLYWECTIGESAFFWA